MFYIDFRFQRNIFLPVLLNFAPKFKKLYTHGHHVEFPVQYIPQQKIKQN
jgi:hypothetical protein